MTPYYQDEAVTIYHADCRDWMDQPEPLGRRSCWGMAMVTDPPYGIGWRPRVNHQDSPWKDDARPNMAAMVDRFEWSCVWGGNYFADTLPVSNGWLVWMKRPSDGSFDGDTRSYSALEMAWTNFSTRPRTKTLIWDGGKREGEGQNRWFCHPAQKPVEIMRWCVSLVPAEATAIVDPFMGSGTTLVAAKQLGIPCVGIEIEERYCEIAARRLSQGALTEMFR